MFINIMQFYLMLRFQNGIKYTTIQVFFFSLKVTTPEKLYTSNCCHATLGIWTKKSRVSICIGNTRSLYILLWLTQISYFLL